MEAFPELDPVLLATDGDHDGIISLTGVAAGNYKFSIYGGTETNQVYLVVTSCTSYDPTNAPSGSPSPAPTDGPTNVPTNVPSHPTMNPTSVPSGDPTRNPSTEPTPNPTRAPIIAPTATGNVDGTNVYEQTDPAHDEVFADTGGKMDILTVILVIVSCVTVIAIIVVSVAWYILYRKRQRVKEIKERKEAMSRVRSISQDGTVLVPVTEADACEVADTYDNASSSDGESIYDTVPDYKTSGKNHAEIPPTLGEDPKEECDDVVVEGGEGYGICTDYMKNKLGKRYDEDGLFYCDECWRNYDQT
eukprot:866993_1